MYLLLIIIIIILIFDKKGMFKKPASKTTKNNNIKINENLPYHKVEYFFTRFEKDFFNTISYITKDYNVHIFSKVRLADIIYVPDSKQSYKWFNKIKAKHVDFLICCNKEFKPILIIELDDSSHYKQDRIERDKFVDKALSDSNIPILHIKAQYNYNLNELNNLLYPILKPYKETATAITLNN